METIVMIKHGGAEIFLIVTRWLRFSDALVRPVEGQDVDGNIYSINGHNFLGFVRGHDQHLPTYEGLRYEKAS